MGYVNDGDAQFFLDGGNLKTHAFPQLGIQVGQWFVQQQQAGFGHQSAGQSHTLLLSAGQLTGQTLRIFFQVNQFQHFHDLFQPFLFGHVLDLQRITYVIDDIHMGPYGVTLEHHTDSAFFRRQEKAFFRIGNFLVPDHNHAFRRFLKPGDHPQGGSLAAAGRAQERNKFAVRHFNIKISYRGYIAIPFVYMLKL